MRNCIDFGKEKCGRLLFYVPKEMENNIIRYIHDKFGHFGTTKCLEQIRLHYWFPDMKDKSNLFIKNCIQCILHAPPKRKN